MATNVAKLPELLRTKGNEAVIAPRLALQASAILPQ